MSTSPISPVTGRRSPAVPIPPFELPPLPVIQNPKYANLVFTHSSMIPHLRNASSFDLVDGDADLDNEKLEHIGDALIGSFVTLLLQELYKDLKVGAATVLKARLVNNDTHAQIARRYGLPAHMKAHPGNLLSLRASEKSVANLLEAYVGGLFYSYLSVLPPARIPTPPRTPQKQEATESLADHVASDSNSAPVPAPLRRDTSYGEAMNRLEEWLRPLYTPLAQFMLEEMRQEKAEREALMVMDDSDLDDNALGASARLNEYFIKESGQVPDYQPSRIGLADWSITCIAKKRDGTEIRAEATRPSKKKASTVAAYKICKELGLLSPA